MSDRKRPRARGYRRWELEGCDDVLAQLNDEDRKFYMDFLSHWHDGSSRESSLSTPEFKREGYNRHNRATRDAYAQFSRCGGYEGAKTLTEFDHEDE